MKNGSNTLQRLWRRAMAEVSLTSDGVCEFWHKVWERSSYGRINVNLAVETDF